MREIATKQTYWPKDVGPHNTVSVGNMGLENPNGTTKRSAHEWAWNQVLRDPTFVMVAVESFSHNADQVGYTKQDGYLKVNFWLSGRHTTILNGFGEYWHERPEVLITGGPLDMLKVDMLARDSHVSTLSLNLLPEFFPAHLGLNVDDLPDLLRNLFAIHNGGFVFHRLSLPADLFAAARAVLAAPFSVRRQPRYAQAKAVELMCLLINHLECDRQRLSQRDRVDHRYAGNLHYAKEILMKRYAEDLTLPGLAREVGLNRTALSSGFRQMFGLSVYDYLQKIRMDRAYDLLQDRGNAIRQVAEAVGYQYSCNFSTAFRSYFGFTPQAARGRGDCLSSPPG